MSRQLYVSVDLDSLRHHSHGHGITLAASPANPVMALGVPRFLDLFERLGIRATFFVVAEDAAANAGELRRAVRLGHEIASHSLTHPMPFAGLAPDLVEEEATRSRRLLEDLLGLPVRGFRAPGFSVSAAVLERIGGAGYAYDSSLLPSPYLLASLLRLPGYSRDGRRSWVPAAARSIVAPRLPRPLPGGLWELPVSVTPLLRMPLLHTLNLMLGVAAFERITRDFERAQPYAHYVLHGIDLLQPEEVDRDLHAHPGARLPLAEKTMRIEGALRRLSRQRASCRLDEFPGLDRPESTCSVATA